MAFVGGLMPIERPKELQIRSRSAYNSPISSPIVPPAGSRRGSVSSVGSAYTDPGHDRFRQFSTASSVDSSASTASKSGFKSLFSKKEKKSKEKKDTQKIVLTSKYSAAVKTKMMMDAHNNKGKKDQLQPVKTANVVGTVHSGHLTAAQQEARHPHSGPPALHPSKEMASLTRIVSADEPDEEDEFARNERLREEYALSKQPTVTRVVEHASDESAETSADEQGKSSSRPTLVSRPSAVTRNSFGGRFHRDEKGMWRR